jgi:hypothetical protein
MRKDSRALRPAIEIHFDVMNRTRAGGLVAPNYNAALCLVTPRIGEIVEPVVGEGQ